VFSHNPKGDAMKKSLLVRSGVFALAVLMCGVAGAQNPADVVPDKMPFDIPYGPGIRLAQADQVMAAAQAEMERRQWRLNCAVVDSSAHLVLFRRMDQTQLGSIDIAMHKARAAAKFRRNTLALENAIANNPGVATLDDAIASRGGVLIIAKGEVIGAIGCSGGTGSQDELIAKVGAAAVSQP
jgi:glc operon protein GlcG